MGEAQRLATQFDASELDDILVNLNLLRLWIAQGRLRDASHGADRWLEERTSLRPVGSYYIRELDRTTLARVRFAEGRVYEALAILDELLDAVRRLGRIGAVIEIQVLRAVCLWRRDEREPALAALEDALRLAEPEGYVRVFVDCPDPITPLLYRAVARGIAGGYAGRLLAAVDGVTPATAAGLCAEQIVEPLSERELEVLRLLAEGLSNKQVAERLFISLPTVKWHTSNIYGKLEVPNRTRAVARARALGLIPLL
jgi:LuxR family maltose regulon positive regulatory protein